MWVSKKQVAYSALYYMLYREVFLSNAHDVLLVCILVNAAVQIKYHILILYIII